jgi:hypothetical protein
VGLVLLELGTALLFAFLPSTILATASSIALCAVFSGAGLFAYVRRLSIRCNCFGSATGYQLGLRTIWWAGGLALLSTAALVVAHQYRVVEPPTAPMMAALIACVAGQRLLRQVWTEQTA